MNDRPAWGSYPRRSVPDVLAAAVARAPDKPALLFESERVTYAELEARSNSFAHAFSSLGVGRGDRVAILQGNCPEMVYAWLGLAKLGAIEVGINTAYRGEYLRHPLATTGARVIVADADLADRVLEVVPELPDLEFLVVRGTIPPGFGQAHPRLKILPLVEFAAAPTTEPDVPVKPTYQDPVAVQFTGGTTGPSKGAVMSHNMQIMTSQGYVDAVGQTADDVVYSPLPMFHFSIKAVALMSSFLVAGTAAVDERFSVARTWDRVRHYGATGVNILGSMMLMLWNLPESQDDRTLPVRYIIGVPIPEHLHHKIEQRYDCRLVSVYGMSETGMQTLSGLDQPGLPGASGRTVPHFDVRVFDADDRELPPGEVGEIRVRPLQPHVMFDGYYGDAAATADSLRNLWFHTGDMGRFDEEGNLFYVDRLKDSIRRRGENISSVEVEQIVLKHPAVQEVVAHAVPSEYTEDEVKLCVIVKPDQVLDVEDLMDYCVANLPFFAVPRYVEFFSDLPRTPVGRPQKNVLRERGVTPDTWDREKAGYVVTR